MARFEKFSRGRSFRDKSRNKSFDRDKNRPSMTEVTCASCGRNCEVPFKPTNNKPVYCSNCFRKDSNISNKEPAPQIHERDLDIINEKLNKIMKALKIN